MGQFKNKETILECKVTANPIVYSAWKRNGVELSNSHKYRIEIYDEEKSTITISLRIRNLQDQDFGKYTCEAKNKYGRDSEIMILYGMYIAVYRQIYTGLESISIPPGVYENIIYVIISP